MTMVPHDTLPLATTSPFTPRGPHRPPDWQGWAAAMAGAARSHSGAPAGVVPRTDTNLLAALPLHGSDASGGTGTVCGERAEERVPTPLGGPSPGVRSQATEERDGREPVRSLSGPSPWRDTDGTSHGAPTSEDSSGGSSASRQRTGRMPPEPAPALRVHVEHRPGGVAVWLGANRSFDPESLRAVFAALRAPSRPGPAIVAVTCNGAAIFTRSPAREETP